MRVLVTGASGLLGNNIVRELINRKYEVQVLLRSTSNLISMEGLSVEKLYGDIRDLSSLENTLKPCDVIIHAAAMTRKTTQTIYEEFNLTGTKNILKVGAKLGIKKFIYVSTANVFGYGNKDKPGNELVPFAYTDIESGYIQSKYKAVQFITSQHNVTNFEIVQVAPTFLIGPYDFGPSSGKIIQLGLKNRFVICPPGGKNFIYVKDAADAICNAIDLGKHKEAYLLANKNLTYTEFYTLLEKVLKKKLMKIYIPKSLLLTIGFMSSLMEKIFGKHLLLNNTSAKLLSIDNYYSGQKAIKELNLKNTPIEIAIQDAVEWFKQDEKK